MGLRGDRFKVATCAASTAIWIATCGRPDVADVKKLQRVPSPLQSFVAKHSEKSGSLLFVHCSQLQMLLTSAFSKENSAFSLEECVLGLKVFATALRKLGVKVVRSVSLRGEVRGGGRGVSILRRVGCACACGGSGAG